MKDMAAITDQIRRMEEALASQEVRSSELALSTILHPDFLEIGKSGRMFDYDAILKDLAGENAPPAYAIENLSVTSVEEGIVLATYQIPTRTVDGIAYPATMRSSLWVKFDGTWRLRFHQGTIIPA